MLLMGKSTISMAIFHCYVSSPEGIFVSLGMSKIYFTTAFTTAFPTASVSSVAHLSLLPGLPVQHQRATSATVALLAAKGHRDGCAWSEIHGIIESLV